MKNVRNNKLSLGALSLMFFVCTYLFLSAAGNYQEAQQAYQDGIAAFRTQEYQTAADLLRHSYETYPNSVSAYILSCVYVKLNDSKNAKIYADRALNDPPVLGDSDKKYVDTIQKWARGEIGIIEVRTAGKADESPPENAVEVPLGRELPMPAQ
jgi:tetratricopeptide (TPR) repeat protein